MKDYLYSAAHTERKACDTRLLRVKSRLRVALLLKNAVTRDSMTTSPYHKHPYKSITHAKRILKRALFRSNPIFVAFMAPD